MRKTMHGISINEQIRQRGYAMKSITLDEYEELEKRYDLQQWGNTVTPRNGKRNCRIAPKK